MDDIALDVPIAPQAVLARVAGAINRRPKRLFGVLKVEPEYVGFVRELAFEIWERRQQAVHAYGRVRGQRGGTRIELRVAVTTRTWILIAVFFALFAVVAAEISSASAPSELPSWLIASAGALVTAAIFVIGARRQRDQLVRFVTALFADAADQPEAP